MTKRKNRSLIEMARCMLYRTNMQLKCWAEAIYNANYIQNRLLCSAINVIPFEVWCGKQTNLKYIRSFGFVAYAHINK